MTESDEAGSSGYLPGLSSRAEPNPVAVVLKSCCSCLRSSSTAKQTKLLLLFCDRERGRLNPDGFPTRMDVRSDPNWGTTFMGTVVVTNPMVSRNISWFWFARCGLAAWYFTLARSSSAHNTTTILLISFAYKYK